MSGLSAAREAAADSRPSPAPWLLKGSGWVFVTHAPFSKTPIPLPAGSYDPFEAGSSFDKSAEFHGGSGAVMLARYTDSPVGESRSALGARLS